MGIVQLYICWGGVSRTHREVGWRMRRVGGEAHQPTKTVCTVVCWVHTHDPAVVGTLCLGSPVPVPHMCAGST